VDSVASANALELRYSMVMLAQRLVDHDDTPHEDKIVLLRPVVSTNSRFTESSACAKSGSGVAVN